MADPFIGEIRIVTYTYAPYGWADCNGASITVSQNNALYAVIGVTYGGVAGTSFLLPNLMGKAPVGMGAGPGLSTYVAGQTGGAASVTLAAGQLAAHTHAAMASSAHGTKTSPVGNVWATAVTGRAETPMYAAAGSTVAMSATMASAGTGGPHNNLPPYVVVRYVIATLGLFPSRE